jgi:hypothetical protein
MTTKTNTVDWGGLTLDVSVLRTGATSPGTEGTAVTATAAEINLAADISGRAPIVITGVTEYAALAANSGKVHVLAAIASDCTITLPAAAAGLHYEFWFCSTAAEAQNFVIVPTAGVFKGGLLHADVGGTTAAVYSNGSSHDTLTVVTPAAGTVIKLISDGTDWYLCGTDSSATIATLA